jgi:hypothetical protein
MPNYQNGKIYKLMSFQTDKVYIGSTTQALCERKAGHLRDYKRYLAGNGNYITSFEIIKFGDADIVLLEDFPCEKKEQLHARERYHIEILNCCNKAIPTRTKKEYRENHKDELTAYAKVYRENNKDKICEYWQKNKDNLKETHKAYSLEYYANNAEELKRKQSKYRQENLEIIRQKDRLRKQKLKTQN